IDENKDIYPVLSEKCEYIKMIIKVEEENFAKTIDQGLILLHDFISKANGKTLTGEDAFKLYDTYGFPLDLTKEILAEKSMTVDEGRFKELLESQKERARSARQSTHFDAWKLDSTTEKAVPPTIFSGYESLQSRSKVIRIFNNKKEPIKQAAAGENVLLVLDKTPCYAQSGGQVGDIGTLRSDGCQAKILDTTKNAGGVFFHKVKILSGSLSSQDVVSVEVDENFRQAVTRNHSAAHLLQAALRKVFGNHVQQAGQLVSEKIVRFDFTHFSALSPKDISAVENLVNKQILSAINCEIKEMSIDQAKKIGAMALFGEKYGEKVRVVQFDDFSVELCGGTHVSNSGQIGLFKIISENSVASGVRRIEAVTGQNLLELLNEKSETIALCSSILQAQNISELPSVCSRLMKTLKEKDGIIEKLNTNEARAQANALLEDTYEIANTKIIAKKLEDTSAEKLKAICDIIKGKLADFVLLLVAVDADKAVAAACVGSDALKKGFNAGDIVKKIVAFTGGKGGGKADFAMAGIKEIGKIDLALSKIPEVLKGSVK
ncbi:MAG: alanine--tRNA ligase, partial [Clostridia bacterium]|nr:alanine--tRNA ligase [Clostridia bacterium]